MHWLFIDDEEDLLLVFQGIIENLSRNCKVSIATTYAMALKIIMEKDIDLVVTDWSLPNNESLKIINYCQKRSISIIINSGYPKEEIYRLAEKLNLNNIDVIEKTECLEFFQMLIKKGA